MHAYIRHRSPSDVRECVTVPVRHAIGIGLVLGSSRYRCYDPTFDMAACRRGTFSRNELAGIFGVSGKSSVSPRAIALVRSVMEQPTISSDEFKKRLAQLCLTAKTAEMPSRQRDRHILLKAISLNFETGRLYTEPEVNGVIEDWLTHVGQSLEVDHVTLRRALVDEAYLTRAVGGAKYQVGSPSCLQFCFSTDVTAIDAKAVIHDAIQEIARRRQLYQKT